MQATVVVSTDSTAVGSSCSRMRRIKPNHAEQIKKRWTKKEHHGRKGKSNCLVPFSSFLRSIVYYGGKTRIVREHRPSSDNAIHSNPTPPALSPFVSSPHHSSFYSENSPYNTAQHIPAGLSLGFHPTVGIRVLFFPLQKPHRTILFQYWMIGS